MRIRLGDEALALDAGETIEAVEVTEKRVDAAP
jgi:hypothetical protein